MTIQHQCSVCGSGFEPQFRYQMEERVEADETGRPRARFVYFCTQRCLERSHRGEALDGAVSCDACASSFQVELASQVLFLKGRRHYACSTDCRTQLMAEARGARLIETLAPPPVATRQVQAQPATPVVESSPAQLSPTDGTLPAVLDPVRATLPPPRPSASISELPPPSESVTPLPPMLAQLGRDDEPPSARRPTEAVMGTAPRILAVFNHKGGTGKTTTSVTMAAGLAERGKRVLLVDTDGQGNVAVSFGIKPTKTLYHVLVMGLPLKEAIENVRPGLDVLSSNETLAAAELYLAGRKNRDRVLAARLESARHEYDYVIVDCSPSLSLMNQNALVLADGVLCPVACDYLSLVGVRQVLRTIKQVQKLLSHPVQLWGVLPTMFDGRVRICNEAYETLQQHFGDRCLDPIRTAIKVKEAPAQAKTLLEHAAGSSVAGDYLRVVDRLLSEAKAERVAPPRAAGGVR